MQKVFISRNLHDSSPIRKIDGIDIKDRSLIHFEKIPFDPPEADYIFFYSKNGVRYFFDTPGIVFYPYQWACIGRGTADLLSEYVQDIAFVGSGDPEFVAEAYKRQIPDINVTCFIRAQNSKDSINTLINNPNDFSLAVYNNTPVDNVPDDHFDILVFTSPLNAESWLKYQKVTTEKVIAIGKTTAEHLASEAIKGVVVADNPSEEAIAKCIRNILST